MLRTNEVNDCNNLNRSGFDADVAAIVENLEKIDSISIMMGSDALSRPSSIHDLSGTLLWSSPRMADILGLERNNTHRSILEHVHVQDRVTVGRFLSRHDKPEGSVETCQFRLMPNSSSANKKPSISWAELSASTVVGTVGGKPLTLVTLRDISQAKIAEQQASELQEKAEQANIAKSKFLANISHELRTPLNAILGFSELLNTPGLKQFTEEKRAEYIDLIHTSADHLLTLLNGILDMSKIENGMYEIFPETFDLSKCLQTTASIMRGQAELKSQRILVSGLETLPEIVADERAVKQVMINLLSNAIKFSDAGTQVHVNCERRARQIRISVTDSGIGISPEHMANLGQPFFQADSKYDRKFEGTGLGLSVVKGLVELHKGNVHFASTRGKGTTVTITLPIYGQRGRQVPASSLVEKITPLHRDADKQGPTSRLLRNTA